MNDTNLDKIFGRNYKVLRLFLLDLDKEFYITEVSEKLQISKMTVYRTLEEMVETKLLKSRTDNYRKFYKLKDSPIIRPLKVLANLDSLLVTEFLKKFKLKSHLIILYGSRANGTDRPDSDWDFIIVSDELDPVGINKTVSNLEIKYETQINVKLYTRKGYTDIKANKAPFYQEIMANKVVMRGDINEA